MLIIGASSSLGRAMAEALAAKGCFVYAGARKDGDLEELNAQAQLTMCRQLLMFLAMKNDVEPDLHEYEQYQAS